MNITIRSDTCEIEGYVNAVERKSKPIHERSGGVFRERISAGAFARALKKNDDVRILLNHDPARDLGGTKDGTLELAEDNIGLHARAKIKDKDVCEAARRGDLIGWSFGFKDPEQTETEEDGMRVHDVKNLDLREVSILDRSHSPAYAGTLLMVRDENPVYFSDPEEQEINVREIGQEQNEPKQQEAEKPPVDYGKYEKIIAEMKGVNK